MQIAPLLLSRLAFGHGGLCIAAGLAFIIYHAVCL